MIRSSQLFLFIYFFECTHGQLITDAHISFLVLINDLIVLIMPYSTLLSPGNLLIKTDVLIMLYWGLIFLGLMLIYDPIVLIKPYSTLLSPNILLIKIKPYKPLISPRITPQNITSFYKYKR